MADEFKREMLKKCSVGGLKCSCCNPYFGKERMKLSRIARRTLKSSLKKDLDNFG